MQLNRGSGAGGFSVNARQRATIQIIHESGRNASFHFPADRINSPTRFRRKKKEDGGVEGRRRTIGSSSTVTVAAATVSPEYTRH